MGEGRREVWGGSGWKRLWVDQAVGNGRRPTGHFLSIPASLVYTCLPDNYFTPTLSHSFPVAGEIPSLTLTSCF